MSFPDNDKRYKRLFSNPILVQELLESFVDLPFVILRIVQLERTYWSI